MAEHAEARERRNQLRHPNYSKPELLATGANQLWLWAQRLIEQTTPKHQIHPRQLTIHADRGAAMTSKADAL